MGCGTFVNSEGDVELGAVRQLEPLGHGARTTRSGEAEHLRGILEEGLQHGIFDHEFLAQVLYKFCWYSPEVATSKMMDLLHSYLPDIL